ncbi:PKD domain-containing protein [Rhodocytophaga rosea]|uniref:PKD domain-containing protein n=1 Tax=Rhodocytophaga rosea TaxID=2704465 RepID=A0A6C0GSL3_9BACT|nr:Ig-like domain-containing protein [Rhodocytophaga rosea]QHT70947.1 PKD domain-containing protein [Rhodocytophaga rosea]
MCIHLRRKIDHLWFICSSFHPHLTKLFLATFILLWCGCCTEVFSQTPPSGFSNTLLSSGWNEAVGMTFSKDGNRMFVWERAGKVWVVENGVKSLLLDISPEVGAWHDHGMLGFALDPKFEINGYFYVLYVVDRHHLLYYGTASYSETTNLYSTATIGRLTRYTATTTANGYTASDRKILLGATKSTGIPTLSRTHGVGSLVFGTDGTLLVSAGDGASPSGTDIGGAIGNSYAPQGLNDGIITTKDNVGSFRSQLLDSPNGKILRIDPETGAGIPSNPFYDPANPNSVRSKVWALGLRNPFRTLLKPGTGSHNPDDANPGVLYVGDVGWNVFEELNVIDRPGLNLGWPIFEGLDYHSDPNWPSYATQTTENQFAPNPLYGINGCTRQYFRFNELLKQATASGTSSFPNPCDASQTIPPAIPTFIHTRPILDWKHGTDLARTGIFNGETAAIINVGASGSPVSGPMFRGNASTGGVFYTGDDFPPEYKNTYFHGDYGAGWIRNVSVTTADKPVAITNFINNTAIVVYMATHPITGGLYYINFGSEIRKITNTSNLPPNAVASVDNSYGTSPLTVQFTGSNSTDPEGFPLTYEWNFGDGSAISTEANPSHTFTTNTAVPTKFTVTLKVSDNIATDQTTLVISANNTPPNVTITSPVNNGLYSINEETTLNLRATVTDQEHSASQLSYQWQTTLHHEDHMHPEPIDTQKQTTTTIDPIGCDGQSYFYRITLTVTDGAGLSTTKEVRLYPNCGGTNILPTVGISSPENNAGFTVPASIVINADASDEDGAVTKVEFYNGATKLGEAFESPYSFNWSDVAPGTYQLTAKATDNLNGSTTSSMVTVNVSQVSAQLPAPWRHTDIGAVAITGGASFNNGVFTVKSSGYDYWIPPDAFHYVYQPVSGNSTIIAKVNSIEATNANALAGMMFRESLDANSSFVATVVNPRGTLLMSRQGTSQPAYQGQNGSAPTWLKLVRNTDAFTASHSSDGVNWTPLWETTITMGNTIYVGLSLTSHDTTLINTSTFSDVSVISSGNLAPSANIIAPATNTSFNAPATVIIEAQASDTDGTISKIEFYQGSIKLGEDLTSPYSYSWTNVGAGSYQLTAKAIDNLNATTTSSVVNITVSQDNQAPIVSLTAPANNSTFTAGNNITLTATATDADGSVSKVEFYQGTTKIGEDLSSPYEFTWSNVSAGSYQLTAIATDNLNAVTTSSVITITVSPAAAVSFYRALNLNGGTLTIDTRTFEASATAAGFTYSGRVFANQNITLSPATDAARASMIRSSIYSLASAPASLALSGVSNGEYDLYLYVWEDSAPEPYSLTLEGQVILSNYSTGGKGSWAKLGPYRTTIADGILNIGASGGAANLSGLELWKVNQPVNQLPIVALTSPVNNASFTAPASVSLAAAASDADGTVSKVEFYQGTTKLGEDLTSPYSYSWTNVGAGSYQLTAKAIDNLNATTTSSVVNITVSQDNQAPIVSLTAPANNSTFTAGNNITLTATASDADGSVSKVEFYQGTTKIGEDLSSPYEFTWSNVAAGSYQITAIATDNLNAVTTSSVITITVSPAAAVSFYRALNLNGGTLTIDTRTFEASATAAGFTYSGRVFANQNITLSPATDAARASMIRSSIYSLASAPASLALSGVSNGEYDLYLYVWEDSAPEPYSLTLEGQVILSNYSTGGKGSWAKLGPYRTTIADGILNIGASGGAANLSGLELWKVNQPVNQLPTVALTSPVNNASFTAPTSITLAATATDTDGTISKVEFYQGSIKLGEDLSSPYEFTWSNVSAGSYQITAKAIDNLNAVTTSTVVNISVAATETCTASGTILREVWNNVAGNSVNLIPLTTTPALVAQLSSFETPTNIGSNYGQRLRGYICPPQSGSYIFWIASDDKSELWLSSNSDPANKVKIASVTYFTAVREWEKYTTQKSMAISLQAGKRYYIEALHKEGTGTDNLAVGWQLPDGTLERPIAGNRLSPFVSSINRIGDELEEGQASTELLAYPVPASKQISIEFSFPESQQATLQLFDMRGNLVANLFDQPVEAGDKQQVVYQVGSLANGMYLIRLAGKRIVKPQKIIIDKH